MKKPSFREIHIRTFPCSSQSQSGNSVTSNMGGSVVGCLNEGFVIEQKYLCLCDDDNAHLHCYQTAGWVVLIDE